MARKCICDFIFYPRDMKHSQVQFVFDASVHAEMQEEVEDGLTAKRVENVNSVHAVCIHYDFQVIHPHSLQLVNHAHSGECLIEENHFTHQVRRDR